MWKREEKGDLWVDLSSFPKKEITLILSISTSRYVMG